MLQQDIFGRNGGIGLELETSGRPLLTPQKGGGRPGVEESSPAPDWTLMIPVARLEKPGFARFFQALYFVYQ